MSGTYVVSKRDPSPPPAGEAPVAPVWEGIPGLVVLDTLPHGALVRADVKALRLLQQRGVYLRQVDSPDILQVGDHRIHLPTYRPEKWGLRPQDLDDWRQHCVSFRAPPPPAWIRALEAVDGVAVLTRVGDYAVTIAAQRGLALDLAAHPTVRWVVPYAPPWKRSPNVRRSRKERPAIAITIRPPGAKQEVLARVVAIVRDLEGPQAQVLPLDGPTRPIGDVSAPDMEEHPRPQGAPALLRVRLPRAAIDAVTRIPTVWWVDIVPERYKPLDELGCLLISGISGNGRPPRGQGYGVRLEQLGVDGTGTLIAFGEQDGVLSEHPALKDRQEFPTPPALSKFVVNDHGTMVAGVAVGGGGGQPELDTYDPWLGAAPKARFGVVAVKDLGRIEKYLGQATDHHASVFNASFEFGPKGAAYGEGERDVDRAVRGGPGTTARPPIVVVVAAGNYGPCEHTLTCQAKNAILVGASICRGNDDMSVDQVRTLWEKSSVGPSHDGRFLPCVVAPGWKVASASYSKNNGQIKAGSASRSGTSFACPHVAGLCALVQQHWNNVQRRPPSPAMVRAALVDGAIDCHGTDFKPCSGPTGTLPHRPDATQGWGLVRLEHMLLKRGRGPILHVESVENGGPAHLVEDGQIEALHVITELGAMPLRVTLAWTDPAVVGEVGIKGIWKALRNDLDLEVEEVPTGVRFRGNQLDAKSGYSMVVDDQNELFRDDRNNLEHVHVSPPDDGKRREYIIRVIARALTADARFLDGVSALWQDWALVIGNASVVPARRVAAGVAVEPDGKDPKAEAALAGVEHWGPGLLRPSDTLVPAVTAEAISALGEVSGLTPQDLATLPGWRAGLLRVHGGMETIAPTSLRAAVVLAPASQAAGASDLPAPDELMIFGGAWGMEADGVALRAQCEASGGLYLACALADDLHLLNALLWASVTGRGLVMHQRVTVIGGAVGPDLTLEIPVDASAGSLHVFVRWAAQASSPSWDDEGDTSAMRIRLERPNGLPVHPDSAEVALDEGPGTAGLRVTAPPPGVWKLHLSSPDTVDLVISALVESTVQLAAVASPVSVAPGEPVIISLTMEGAVEAMWVDHHAEITADGAASVATQATMDPVSPGILSASLASTHPGPHLVVVTASGAGHVRRVAGLTCFVTG